MAYLCGGCTDATAVPVVAEDAGRSSDAGRGGTSGGGSGAGASGRSSATGGRSGAGGSRGWPPANCATTEAEQRMCAGEPPRRSEEALFLELNEAIDAGRFCLGTRLIYDADLGCLARCWADVLDVTTGTRPPGSRPPPPQLQPRSGWVVEYGRAIWTTQNAPTLADAKNALFSDPRQDLCDSTRNTAYISAGVGQVDDAWVVYLDGTPITAP